MSDDSGVEFAVNRMRDLGRMLEGAMIDFPRVLKALERARNGTPEQLHEEAAIFAARAKKAEDQVRYRESVLSIAAQIDRAADARAAAVLIGQPPSGAATVYDLRAFAGDLRRAVEAPRDADA